MLTEELIKLIQESPKKTPLVAFVQSDKKIPQSYNQILIGQQHQVLSTLQEYFNDLQDVQIFCQARNSAIAPLNIEHINARIEFGALIRDHVKIGENAVIMMGAILNIGSSIGQNTMIDMGAVIGARAQIGKNCHIGANSVIAGVLEPPSAKEVIIEDDVLIGASAVVLEGVTVKKGAVVAAGAIVIEDVPENAVVAGCPAKVVKFKDKKTELKTQFVEALREL